MTLPLLSAGAFPSSDVLVPLPSVVSSPGTPLSSAELPQQPLGGTSLPSVPSAPSTSCTYVSISCTACDDTLP